MNPKKSVRFVPKDCLRFFMRCIDTTEEKIIAISFCDALSQSPADALSTLLCKRRAGMIKVFDSCIPCIPPRLMKDFLLLHSKEFPRDILRIRERHPYIVSDRFLAGVIARQLVYNDLCPIQEEFFDGMHISWSLSPFPKGIEEDICEMVTKITCSIGSSPPASIDFPICDDGDCPGEGTCNGMVELFERDAAPQCYDSIFRIDSNRDIEVTSIGGIGENLAKSINWIIGKPTRTIEEISKDPSNEVIVFCKDIPQDVSDICSKGTWVFVDLSSRDRYFSRYTSELPGGGICESIKSRSPLFAEKLLLNLDYSFRGWDLFEEEVSQEDSYKYIELYYDYEERERRRKSS